MSEPRLIGESAELASLCAEWRGADFITVDTEFMRESTYRAKLCLVQIGPPESEPVAVDPLAGGIDLTPLYDLLVRTPVLKVFHAARQDVEVLLPLAGGVPQPLFDTQIAAMVCGFGESVGYETLVAKLARGRIDKTQRFTDWARRPLTELQLRYALSDVSHLRVVYEKLAAELERTGRHSWLDEELAVITGRATYEAPPEEAWRRLKVRGNNRRFLAILRELAAWREVEADRRDKPRPWVLRDTALSEIAAQRPRTVDQLAKLRSVSQRTAESATGAALLDAVKRGLALPDAECPSLPQRSEKSSAPGALTDLLKVLLTFKSEETGVARKLIANTRGSGADRPRRDVGRAGTARLAPRALRRRGARPCGGPHRALGGAGRASSARRRRRRRSCGSAGSARRGGGGFVSASAPWFDAPQLTGDDPPPFTRIGPDRADPQFVLVCDHASNAVPAHMERLGLDQAELDRHIGWDIGAAMVTESLSARLDAPAFLSGYSRLVVDCNRPLGSPTAMPVVSDGTVVPANQTISPAEAAARTDALFWPYHNAIAACLDRVIGAGAVPMLIAVHSFTPVFDGFARPWEIGLLYEHDDRLVQPLKDALLAVRPGLTVGDNEPYAIIGPSDYSIPVHGQGRGLPHIEFEVRQDLIGTVAGAEEWAGTLAQVLNRVHAALAPLAIENRVPAGAGGAV